MATRKVVKVFLASPGDLAEERIAARTVVDEFNSIWADQLGYQIDLVGWEDTVSQYGRPQSAINRELEQCELFYGMLWKRWGTPPAVSGPYSSGFEEEFRLSQERFRRTGLPAIKLAFKKVDSELLRDPGKELQKVIDFRESLVAEKEVLFETFDDIKQFQSKFNRAISTYVQQLAEKCSKEANQVERVDTPPTENETDGTSPNTALLSFEGTEFLRGFVQKTENHAAGSPVTATEVARFRLLGAIAGRQGNDEGALGVHDAHLMYQDRASTILGHEETYGLIESGLEHFKHENAPLWFWYKKANGFQRDSLPFFTAVGSIDIRANALAAMRLIGQAVTPSGTLDRDWYINAWLSDSADSRIKNAALAYLADWGMFSDLPHVRTELDRGDYQTRGAAADAFFKITCRESRAKALEALNELQTDSLSDDVIGEIFASSSGLPDSLLLKATEHRNAAVRLAATKLLRRRKALPPERAEQLMKDDSADVRREGFLSLRSGGREFTEAETRNILIKTNTLGLLGLGGPRDTQGEANYQRLREADLRKLTESQLTELVEEQAPFGEEAYLARVDTFYDKFSSDLKVAVADAFVSHRRAAVDKVLSAIPSKSPERFQQVSEFVRRTLTRGGLTIIEKRNDPSDLDVVRQVLRTGFVSWADSDAEYLGRYGEWEDIKLLGDAAGRPDYSALSLLGMYSNFTRHRPAAKAIYRLAQKRVRELISMPLDSMLTQRIILEFTDVAFRTLDYQALRPLFLSESDAVRKTAVVKAVKALSRSRLEGLLSNYLNEERYFYNVIHWLDFGINVPRERAQPAAARMLSRQARS